jgi:clan AA aspartic protease (TIGR02281 family)
VSNVIQFNYDSCEDIEYEENKGHYYLHVPAFYTKGSNSNRLVDFMLDTGAFLTVITLQTARLLGYDQLTPVSSNIILSGYAGEIKADLLEIPGLVIGGRILEGTKVAVPKESERHEIKGMNILGLNVLEYFNYLVDSTNCKIYFAKNEKYKIPKEFECVNIRSVSGNH